VARGRRQTACYIAAVNEQPEQAFAWKSAVLWTVGIGTGVGLFVAALEIVLGISVHPGIGGILAALAIGIVVTRLNRPRCD